MLKKSVPSGKINGAKNFLSRAATHHSFIFNFRFLCELKVRLSKNVCGIFHFRFGFVFIKAIFLFNKIHELFDLKKKKS